MKKYVQIINEETKECSVGIGNNVEYYKSIGMIEQDVEQAYNGHWYIMGFAPSEPKKTYVQKRQEAYPSLPDQLDMIYWDKVNNTNIWQETIAAVKAKYPKE